MLALHAFLTGIASSMVAIPPRLYRASSYRADHIARLADAYRVGQDVKLVLSRREDEREFADAER